MPRAAPVRQIIESTQAEERAEAGQNVHLLDWRESMRVHGWCGDLHACCHDCAGSILPRWLPLSGVLRQAPAHCGGARMVGMHDVVGWRQRGLWPAPWCK